ncbi:MAG: hypothetical protein NVSMB6_29000 [Burkholderiaceae bacterium]
MSHIEILIPFGLPPAELAVDLLRELQMPALATLLARSRCLPAAPGVGTEAQRTPVGPKNRGFGDGRHDAFARALPHEVWLARHFGLADPLQADNSPPVAAALMSTFGMEPEPGYWFVVQPVHYHVARDHLVLTDPRQLALEDADARALFAAALPSFAETGLELLYGRADCWFVRADRHRDLVTATPDATCGHNIDIWMPQGASARAWRRLQNEVQMEWHTHRVNETRAADSRLPVNSLWLWGGAAAPIAVACTDAAASAEALFNLHGWYAAFGQYTTCRTVVADADVHGLLTNTNSRRLLVLDDLIGPALAGDWVAWIEKMRALETCWFAPILMALQERGVASVSLVLNHNTHLHQWWIARSGLRKFWQKPALARLLS